MSDQTIREKYPADFSQKVGEGTGGQHFTDGSGLARGDDAPAPIDPHLQGWIDAEQRATEAATEALGRAAGPLLDLGPDSPDALEFRESLTSTD